jgi:hypothetical protein
MAGLEMKSARNCRQYGQPTIGDPDEGVLVYARACAGSERRIGEITKSPYPRDMGKKDDRSRGLKCWDGS